MLRGPEAMREALEAGLWARKDGDGLVGGVVCGAWVWDGCFCEGSWDGVWDGLIGWEEGPPGGEEFPERESLREEEPPTAEDSASPSPLVANVLTGTSPM